jgi:hypothetical protein
VAIAIGKGFHLIRQWEVGDAEEIPGAAKIPIHQLVHGQLIVTTALGQVALISLEAARLDGFKLLAHELEVRAQSQLRAVVEDQVIGWIDS